MNMADRKHHVSDSPQKSVLVQTELHYTISASI
jgi:hypothetical protein